MTHEDLLASWKYVLVAAVSILINLVIAITAAHFLRLPRSRGGVFIAQSFLANTIFIGVPVCTQLFGDVSIPYLMMYYLASTTFNQSLAMLLVSHAGTGGAKKITPAGLLHDIVTKPPIIGIIVSVCCLVIGYRPPVLIMNFAKYLTNCVTPLALIYCGYIIYDLGLKNLKLMRGIPTMLFLRFPVAALVCYACCRLAGMSGLMLHLRRGRKVLRHRHDHLLLPHVRDSAGHRHVAVRSRLKIWSFYSANKTAASGVRSECGSSALDLCSEGLYLRRGPDLRRGYTSAVFLCELVEDRAACGARRADAVLRACCLGLYSRFVHGLRLCFAENLFSGIGRGKCNKAFDGGDILLQLCDHCLFRSFLTFGADCVKICLARRLRFRTAGGGRDDFLYLLNNLCFRHDPFRLSYISV